MQHDLRTWPISVGYLKVVRDVVERDDKLRPNDCIRKIFKVNQDKAIIYDEENGEKEITTADLGIASYLCEDTDPVKAPLITTIRNLDECLNYFWFDKIAEKELASINRTEYIRQQLEIQSRFSNRHSTVCDWLLISSVFKNLLI